VRAAANDEGRGHEPARAHDRCLALLASLTHADLVVLETGVFQRRWGAADLPEARLPLLSARTSIPDAGGGSRYARHPFVEAGVRALLAVPVQLGPGSALLGTVWCLSRRAGAFDDAPLEQVEQTAAVLGELLAPPDDDQGHRRFVEALPIPAMAVVDGRPSANQAFCQLTGYEGARFQTLDAWFTLLFGDEAPSVRAMYDWDRGQGFPERRVVCFSCADGQQRLVEWGARTVDDRELWLFSDVTERAQSQERFRVLFEQSSTALVVYDDHGVVDCNQAAVTLLGYGGKAELLHLEPRELSAPCQPDGRASQGKLAQMEHIAFDLGSHRFDWTYQRLDGAPVQVEVTLTALTLGARRVLLAEWHDISERTRYEDALKLARDSALKHAQAKADFLATMSHEIRTPMNGVIGMTRLLQDTPLSDQQREYVETVRACGEGLLALINDVLDFSKLEAGKVRLEAIGFSLRELAEDAVAVVAESAQHKGLELTSFIAPNVPQVVRGDPTRIRQVLMNLVSNAVKFTSTGAVTVRVAAGAPDNGRSVVTIEVKDTGIGIAHDALPRLFSAFSQEDASTTRRFGGSGLGLAICKRLVSMMGGIIDVITSPNGSTFSLSIAFDVIEAARSTAEFAGRTVHLVESRPLVADSIVQVLRELGAQVHLASSITLAAALPGRPEVLLVGGALTDQATMQFARTSRRRGCAVGLLVPLAVSAEVAGSVDFTLPLPVRRAQLVTHVRRALSMPTLVRSPSQAEQPSFGARVLVAEDNPVNQRVVRGLLAKLGCEAVVVDNGVRAVEVMQEDRFDLVLMDCQMPELDGLSATRIIRAQGHQHHTPILALTAGVLDGDRERCLDAGMDDFLMKPVRLEDLARALALWLHRAA
jgi:PAS domain S-box-containing protein